MENSILKTVSIPAVGNSPAVICRAMAVPLRVLVIFTGGGFLGPTLSYDTNDLFPAVTSSSFTPNAGDVVVLAPGQGLYGVALVPVSIGFAISEMLGT